MLVLAELGEKWSVEVPTCIHVTGRASVLSSGTEWLRWGMQELIHVFLFLPSLRLLYLFIVIFVQCFQNCRSKKILQKSQGKKKSGPSIILVKVTVKAPLNPEKKDFLIFGLTLLLLSSCQ